MSVPRERHTLVGMTRTAFEWAAAGANFAPTTATRDLADQGWTDGLNWAWVRWEADRVVVSSYALNDIGALVEALGLERVAA